MNSLIQNVVEFLKLYFSKDMVVFIISLLPVLELRGGLVAASILKIPYLKAALICIIGNILPIPFVLLFLHKIFDFLIKFEPTKKIVNYFITKAEKNKGKIDKYEFWGLVLFVAIPLPGTGAWTGSLVASVFRMDLKKSLLAIFLGIMIAFVIMSVVSYGIIGNLIK